MKYTPVRLSYRLLSYLVSALLAAQPVLPAVAAVITPQGGTQMDKAANGVPVVNIATPNGAGISHNTYNDFNTGPEGLILNNATGQFNQTQLGGIIQNNTHLKAGQEAKGIINEVTGGNRSQLNGYTEVAGKAANVMVANPYGITCNGCGFINTPQATLTTGKPVFDASGNLQSLDVKGGSITIEGQGIDASNSDALSIISRATEVNAAIHAKDLNVIVGANRVNADGSVQAQQGEGTAPTVAVDTGALGGMYANRIHLVSTETGVGVNLGNLNARQGDITLDVNGKLSVNNSLASGAINATGQSMAFTGDHKASGDITLNSQGDIALSKGSLNSGNNLVLNAGGTLSYSNETLTAGQDVLLTSQNISQDAASQTNAARDITANAGNTTNLQGQMIAGRNLALSTTTLTQAGQLLAKNNAQVNAGTLNNTGSVQGGSLAINSTSLTNSGSLLSGSDLNIRTRDFTQNGSTAATGNAAITATGQLNNTGTLVSNNVLTLNAQGVLQNGTLSGAQGLTVNAQTLASGNTSVTHSDGAMSLTATTAMLDGEVSAGADMQLQGTHLSTASGAQLQSGHHLSITARDVTLAGTQAAQQLMTVSASDTISHSGKSSAAAISLSAPEVNNSGVLVVSTLNIQSHTLTNRGLLEGDTVLAVNTQTLNNQQNGTLYSAANFTLAVPDITNNGLITSDSGLTLTTTTLANPGNIIADRLNLQADTLANSGQLQGNSALVIGAQTLNNQQSGTLYSAANLVLAVQDIANSGLITSDNGLTLTTTTLTNAGNITADTLNAQISKLTNNGLLLGNIVLAVNAQTLNNQQSGTLYSAENLVLAVPDITNNGLITSDNGLTLTTTTLMNPGNILADTLAIQAGTLTNGGQLQGNSALDVQARTLNNQQNGTLYSATNLALTGPDITNNGLIISDNGLTLTTTTLMNPGNILADTLAIQAGTLTNGGQLQGNSALDVKAQMLNNQQNGTLYSATSLTLTVPDITNSGLITSDNGLMLAATTLTNTGNITADTLAIQAGTLSGDGLLQGTTALALIVDTLSQDMNGRWLTAGNLTLKSNTLTTAGVTQGQNLSINTHNWSNNGSVLGTGNLNATLTGSLLNNGGLMSLGNLTFNSTELTNYGSLLATGDISLAGQQFSNHGTLQGSTLSLTQGSVDNQGTMTGLNGLQLNSSGALNNSGGLLSQKTLAVSAGDVINSGRWQGQSITLGGNSLNNSGAIQSALDLALTLSGDVITAIGSKITALGDARIAGNALTNQGLISASTLTMQGSSLTNSNEISGVNGLSLTLGGNLQQQGKMLTGGALTVHAAGITNSGQLQGAGTQINATALTNSGRIQGDSSLTLTLLNTLTNQANGTVFSQAALSLTAPVLSNSGTVQGNGNTQLSATTQVSNNGTILSGGNLTLGTPDYTGSGWLQATSLVLNVSAFLNGGSVIAANQATLTGNSLGNTGLFQAGMLAVNTQTLNNSGTLLGNQSLQLTGNTVSNSNGRLFSGGDMVVSMTSLSGAGPLVALGNLTLKLINSLTTQGVIAAGQQLSVSSQGDITNAGTLQGNGITLAAAGQLTNNGQLTAGSGTTALSGNQIAMNGSGALQAGGDVSLTSQSNITLDGFTGTAGSLLLNAAGAVINTALLYAGNNLTLFANSIQNLHGDILAGNNLLMQKNASGAANTEVINTSGNIETTRGDITMNTGHLLNTRDGLTTSSYTTNNPASISGLGDATIDISISQLEDGTYGKYVSSYPFERCTGVQNVHCTTVPGSTAYGMREDSTEQKYAISQTVTTVSASGGVAGIRSGRNMTIGVGTLDNNASVILSSGDMTLTGVTMSNQSWQNSTSSEFWKYVYQGPTGYADPDSPITASGDDIGEVTLPGPSSNKITFVLEGKTTESELGDIYRSVIQAGGNVYANFTSDISNTVTTANAGQISNTLIAPALNTSSLQNISGGASQQSLGNASALALTHPDWKDTSGSASIGGGTGLTSGGSGLPSGGSGFTPGGTGLTFDGSGFTFGSAGLTPGGKGLTSGSLADNYPLPSGKNGYFVVSSNPTSPYLITVNPKLNGLGQVNPALFGDLYALLGIKPGAAPQETNSQYTDVNQFLGSSYMLNRLGLDPDNNYRFLGDAAFDTRYASNYVLNQTGSRYINGLGSDLDQMRYLMDNAAAAQSALGLTFGVALAADQIADLDHSIIWWESDIINGQNVMVPKVYLSPKDVTVQNGSIISGNNVQLVAGNVSNNGSSLIAQNSLSIDSSNSINNLSAGLISAGGGLDLSALGDINNIGSAISGNLVQLESMGGSINNLTQAEQWNAGNSGRNGTVLLSGTDMGPTASITATTGLYMSAANNINITGANVAAGGDLAMDAGNNINIAANQINQSNSQSRFWGKKDSSASSTSNQASQISAGGNLVMQAGNDLNVTASHLDAGSTAQLVAGNDLNLDAAGNSQTSRTGGSETHHSSADSTTITAGDNVTLIAGRDINSQAAGIAAEKDVGIQAGRDVNLLAEATVDGSSSRGKKKTEIDESVRQQGTGIASGGNTTIIAGRDVNSEAAQVTASGDIGVAAGRDVNLSTATESDYHYKEETKTSKGFLNKKTTHTIEEDASAREAGTLLSGDNVTVQAGNNLLVKGSAVVGDGDVSLGAGNNVDIIAATDTDSRWRFREEKESGLMGSGGIGFTIGSSESKQDLREAGTTQSQSFSTVGSTGGSVVIAAGNQAHIGGADLIAGKDLSLSGSSVLIDPGHDKRTQDETFEQKKSGLTLALSGAVGDAINNAVSSAQDAKGESDGRLAALQATKSVLSGVQAEQAAALDAANKNNTQNPSTNTIGVSVSLTTQKSKSEQHARSDEVAGSTLSAGNNISITANGKKGGGDIVIAGSQLKAGGDTLLDAQNNILLSGAANTQQISGTNSSSGGGVGIGIGVGSGGWGISVFANANAAHGEDKGNGTDWTETTIDSGKTVTIRSGNDTVLDGALVSGNKIVADIGHDLLMSSQQDTNNYDSKQTSVAGGGSFTFGSMTGSGYISVNQDKMKSRFNSVAEQTGLYAGDGGFDITVGNHTQLDGAVIASTATADKNSLDTGTLGFSDIHNEADFRTEHAGGSFNSGGSIAGQFASNMANALLAGSGNKGHEEGTTQAAIANGSITIRDQGNQKQDVADLSRDTEHANDSISPIFDKEKEQKRLQEISLINDIGSQAEDIARTQGAITATKEAQDKMKNVPAADRDAAKAQWEKANPGKTASDDDINGQVYQNYYNTAFDATGMGTGGTVQRGIQAATAALTALAGGGDLAGALAGASAPELANIIGHHAGLSDEETLIAHALLGGAVALLQGNSAAAGAAGALGGELAARVIKDQLFPGKSNSDLSESDKQLVSNLATIASGLAGNLAGGDSGSTITGAQAGKNAVENNTLGHDNNPFEHEEAEHEKEIGDAHVNIIPVNPGVEPKRDEEGNAITYSPGMGVPIRGEGIASGGSNSSGTSTAIQTYWPPNSGFLKEPVNQTLEPGTLISRYGGFYDQTGSFADYGNFVAPIDVPYGMRALPIGTDITKPLSVYQIITPINNVPTGLASPWFGEPGLGVQHQLPLTIQDYLDSGTFKLINRTNPSK